MKENIIRVGEAVVDFGTVALLIVFFQPIFRLFLQFKSALHSVFLGGCGLVFLAAACFFVALGILAIAKCFNPEIKEF